jgi:glycosyltransferase involved in cell wall biosynthesis
LPNDCLVEERNCESEMITTIIPTYRRPERLKKAIQSVLRQTYPHFQICIYDNASGDATGDIVAEFSQDSRVKYQCHAENIGSIENFQLGLSRVETPFFSFLSDDDFLFPGFYEETLRGFEKFPTAIFSAGAVVDVDDEGRIIDIILSKWPDKEFFSPPDGLLEMIGKYSNWAGVLFRKEIIEKIGFLDPHLKAIDVDYLLRAAAHVPFAISKKPVAVFVQHPSSYSGKNGFKLIYPGWPMMADKMKKDLNLPLTVRNKVEQLLQRDFLNLLLRHGIRSIAKRQIEETQAILDILKQHPFIKSNELRRRWIILLLAISIKICKPLPLLLKLRRFCLRRIRRAKHGLILDKYSNE